MREQLSEIKREYEDISAQLNDMETVSDPQKLAELGKKQSEMSETVGKIQELGELRKLWLKTPR